MESSTAGVPIFRFSTLDFSHQDRFGEWGRDSPCDLRLLTDDAVAFDASASGAAIGPFILSGRRWLNRREKATFEMLRTERRIKADGHDFYCFTMPLFGRIRWKSASSEPIKSVGDLFVVDAAQHLECAVEMGDVISLVAPRHLLPSSTALLHGATLTGGIGRILSDHILSLFQNLPNLKQHEVPHVVQSMHQLLIAAVTASPDAMRAAGGQIRNALWMRIQHYIDTHLLEPDLTPDRICRDVGLSRAKLYQLLEDRGGVMRQIQRKRLQRAYHLLSDPNRRPTRIAEVAWSHGFANEKYFHRLFKTEFGHTPHETLEKILNAAPLLNADAPTRSSQRTGGPVGWTLPYGLPSS
ncbi:MULTISPECIES: AraC family transcriptional regulator [unclassified Rhizobium]|jgi:AraC-like DNA-binding protein|uniref:helix-turn-helix domain-containing protein n=1 Tax=unclassified Rhizobium TaxID=2613769 RepID=UPI0006460875|nr:MULTISPECIES: AraC family transcriptional regulator [unclassified Rhizobium]OJY72074.1 MAG: AraC family transcriptional regulator [Rhizobium sp. 60-20]RKD36081.1 AraC family transcriptional regulator [Rhizobium sp. WW_1]